MPVLNAGANLRASVQSILNQDYEKVIEIILSIGPSHDNTDVVSVALKSTDKRVKIIENPSGGTASALNAAAAIATGDYLVRVDAQSKLDKNYIRQAIKTIQEKKAANVGGIQKAEGVSVLERSISSAMTSKFGVGNSKFHYGGDEGPVDTVYLGVYDASIFYELGGFDESLKRNQDYELNIRLRKAGHTVWFDPNLIVRYTPRSTFRALFKQYFQYGQWKRSVIKLHPSSIQLRQIVAPLLILGILGGITISIVESMWGLLIPFIYMTAVVLSTFLSKGCKGWSRCLLLFVFPTMHIAWGLGFFFGPLEWTSRTATADKTTPSYPTYEKT